MDQCPECNGTGYVTLLTSREPCRACGQSPRVVEVVPGHSWEVAPVVHEDALPLGDPIPNAFILSRKDVLDITPEDLKEFDVKIARGIVQPTQCCVLPPKHFLMKIMGYTEEEASLALRTDKPDV